MTTYEEFLKRHREHVKQYEKGLVELGIGSKGVNPKPKVYYDSATDTLVTPKMQFKGYVEYYHGDISGYPVL